MKVLNLLFCFVYDVANSRALFPRAPLFILAPVFASVHVPAPVTAPVSTSALVCVSTLVPVPFPVMSSFYRLRLRSRSLP